MPRPSERPVQRRDERLALSRVRVLEQPNDGLGEGVELAAEALVEEADDGLERVIGGVEGVVGVVAFQHVDYEVCV